MKHVQIELKMFIKSAGLLGWNFNLSSRNFIQLLYGEINFITARRPVFHLVFVKIFIHFLSIFLCKHALNNFFIPLHAKISSQQSGISVEQKRNPALSGWNFSHVIAGYNLWRFYNTAGILAKLSRMATPPIEVI